MFVTAGEKLENAIISYVLKLLLLESVGEVHSKKPAGMAT